MVPSIVGFPLLAADLAGRELSKARQGFCIGFNLACCCSYASFSRSPRILYITHLLANAIVTVLSDRSFPCGWHSSDEPLSFAYYLVKIIESVAHPKGLEEWRWKLCGEEQEPILLGRFSVKLLGAAIL